MNNSAIEGKTAPRSGGSQRRTRLVAILGVASVLVTGTILGQNATAAFAADYPSWGDVQKASGSVAAKQAEITRIDGLLSSLAAAVTTAQAFADKKGEEYGAAKQKLDEAQYKLLELQKQADAEQAKATDAKRQAGQLAARLARAGGGEDLGSTLFFSGDKADDLLSQLGLATLVKDKSAGLYGKAVQAQNTAQSATDQANVAQAALKTLKEDAEKALAEAVVATDKANAAVAEQEGNKTRLEAQRQALVTNAANVKSQYDVGVAAAAAALLKQQQEAAAAAAAHPASGGGGGGGGASVPASSGWARPASGPITSSFGMRVNPVYGGAATLHSGTDIGAGCNAPIYAANAGTVIFAANSGGYGNMVIINHGGGLSTAYGHIVNGGTLVHPGQHVDAGQQIAKVGSTGNSTGCHLHFETRPGGFATNPVPFMSARGVHLG
jgi:murein DD-endopeptidase MepM/ murein hydrolase activator NlpD